MAHIRVPDGAQQALESDPPGGRGVRQLPGRRVCHGYFTGALVQLERIAEGDWRVVLDTLVPPSYFCGVCIGVGVSMMVPFMGSVILEKQRSVDNFFKATTSLVSKLLAPHSAKNVSEGLTCGGTDGPYDFGGDGAISCYPVWLSLLASGAQ